MFLNKAAVEMLRQEYPSGTVIILDDMNDVQAPLSGTKGTVRYVDDTGTIHVDWETGSSLGLIYGEDRFHKINKNKPVVSVKTGKGAINAYPTKNGVELTYVIDEGDGETDTLSIPKIVFEEWDGELMALVWNDPDSEDYTQRIVFKTSDTPKHPKVEKLDEYDYANFVAEELQKLGDHKEIGVNLYSFNVCNNNINVIAYIKIDYLVNLVSFIGSRCYSVHVKVKIGDTDITLKSALSKTVFNTRSLDINELADKIKFIMDYYKSDEHVNEFVRGL